MCVCMCVSVSVYGMNKCVDVSAHVPALSHTHTYIRTCGVQDLVDEGAQFYIKYYSREHILSEENTFCGTCGVHDLVDEGAQFDGQKILPQVIRHEIRQLIPVCVCVCVCV